MGVCADCQQLLRKYNSAVRLVELPIITDISLALSSVHHLTCSWIHVVCPLGFVDVDSYVYDFLELFQKALQSQWQEYAHSMSGAIAVPLRVFKAVEFILESEAASGVCVPARALR